MFGRQPGDGRHQAHRGDRDRTLGDAHALGHRFGQPAHRGQHAGVVGQRLPHAHEHDVGHAPGSPGHLAVREHAGARHHLGDDLGGGQVPGQPGLPGRAERAGHTAARLRRHAHRDPVRIAHQHRLDQRPVERAPQRLAGGPAVAGQLALGGQQPGQQGLGQRVAGRQRQVTHLIRAVGVPADEVPGQLAGPERRLAEPGDHGAALGQRQVGQVTRRPPAAAGRTVGARRPAGQDERHRPGGLLRTNGLRRR